MNHNELKNEYLENEKELESLRIEFKANTIKDKQLLEHFKDDNPPYRFTSILVAGTILGGIEMRNLQRDAGNLKGEKEKFPYTEEQIKMIDRYNELERRQEELEREYEQSEEEDMEM